MRCVQCGHLEDKVIDSRMSKDGTTIRRRRVCLRCDYRYTTYEQIERTELRVVKRDNLREALNREKILRGLVKACEKRPVSMDRLDRAVEEIISELHRDHLLISAMCPCTASFPMWRSLSRRLRRCATRRLLIPCSASFPFFKFPVP